MIAATHKLEDDVADILIDEEQLQARVSELAKLIEAEYRDIDDLLLICVLKGAFIFLSDLSRKLKRPHELDFMGISSYGAGTKSSGAVRIVLVWPRAIRFCSGLPPRPKGTSVMWKFTHS